MKKLFLLLLSMMKIGLFTFGGGYAMIPLLENEFVSKRGWIGDEEFFDLVTVAESTPGPIAVNAATYVGYRVGGIVGAILGTVGIVLPSFSSRRGISFRHCSEAYTQRGWKGQPDGGLAGLGTSPSRMMRSIRLSGSGCGTAESSALV